MELSKTGGNKDQIIIIGAGIAGLSLAIQLAEKNIPCVVLEARQNFDGPTSGVRISAQGVRILEKINIKNVGARTERLIMHFGNREVNFAVKNLPGRSPAIIATRLAIYQKIMERIRSLGIEVIYGFKLSDAVESSDGAIATSEDGQSISGKYLVGADGVGSVVRKILNPGQDSGKTYAGYLGIGMIFPNDARIEMSLYSHPNSNVGLASIGKVSNEDTHNNLFLWTHLHMTEEEARTMSKEMAIEQITAKSKGWSPYLKNLFEECKNNPQSIISYGPVYNGKVPAKWYSNRLFLIGDAAHPYGPGGQGISMALKDAEALCELFDTGITEEKKADFQKSRTKEAKESGESSEERNKPENQISSNLGLFFNGVMMKLMYLFNGGKIKL